VAWVFIFLATRGEAACLAKTQRARGSVRSVQIVLCDVKKSDTQSVTILGLGREIMVRRDFSGFLPFLREVPGYFSTRLGTECVLLL
jgi:hypothetical protein